jgi:uncharacterized protein (DUF1800 family)
MIGPDPQGALIALNRFGLGARPGDLAAAASDPRGFLKQEAASAGVAQIAAPLPASHIALQEMFADQERARQEREAATKAAAVASPRAAAMDPPGRSGIPPGGSAAKPPPPQPSVEQQLFRAEALARFQKQSNAAAGFVERLVAFWSNHFAVSAAKGAFVRVAAGPFEREAIRPHVLGRFKDMLRAVESHPAMLVFLDNQQSIGPNSQAGRKQAKGLNENLARKILELHTLGVGGGYSQADVTSLARILTGWTFAGREGRNGEPGTFARAECLAGRPARKAW